MKTYVRMRERDESTWWWYMGGGMKGRLLADARLYPTKAHAKRAVRRFYRHFYASPSAEHWFVRAPVDLIRPLVVTGKGTKP